MQMGTPKAVELRELYAIIKEIVIKYRQYEKLYEERLKAVSYTHLLGIRHGSTQLQGTRTPCTMSSAGRTDFT